MTLRGPKIQPSMGRGSSPCFTCLKGSEVRGWGGPQGSRVSPGLGLWQRLEGTEAGESQRSPLCAQAPGTTSRTWTASSPRYPFVLCLAEGARETGRQGGSGLGTWGLRSRRPQERPIMPQA